MRSNKSKVPIHRFNISVFYWLPALLLLASCAVSHAPEGVPFAFENKINLKADGISAEEKALIEEKLYTYLDDSLQVPERMLLGFRQRLRPPVFDSGSVSKSMSFMNGYLNSIGYYGASFDSFTVKINPHKPFSLRPGKKKEELRTITTFYITLGKNLRVDSLVYKMDSSLHTPDLQRLADSSRKTALLKYNSPYSKDAVGAELDRLAALFRNRGYFKMTRNALLAVGDTIDPSLVSLDNDPIEQLLLAQKRKMNPRINLLITQRPGLDSMIFAPYLVDTVVFYPETKISDELDELMADKTFRVDTSTRRSHVYIKHRDGNFKTRLIRRNNYLFTNRLYSEPNYFKTINNFWRMGPWQQVDVKTVVHKDSVAKVDFHIFLYPAKKQSFQLDLEGSQNNNISTSDVFSGRFMALSLNATHVNRNAFHQGVQSTTSGRFGFELNNSTNTNNPNFFQTLLASATQTYSLPKLVWPLSGLDKRALDARRSSVNLNAYYTNRFKFYQQRSFSGNLQWDWRKGRNSFSFAFPNFESVGIGETDSLKQAIVNNPALMYAFTPGNILSLRPSFQRVLNFPKHANQSGYYRFAMEATLPVNFKLFNQEFFQFVRFDGQLVYRSERLKSSWNYRAYGSVGWDISRNKEATMPYFRQYVAGGSNSMRAWGLRQLGLGNSIVRDTAAKFPDRFGDIQLELNAEYRFHILRLLGYNLSGALFADAGNVWNHQPLADGNGMFVLKNLYRDMAMDMGTGIRYDLTYLVVRFDMAYKVKDPVREGAGWMQKLEWKGSNRIGSPEKSNVGFQFGIGFPF